MVMLTTMVAMSSSTCWDDWSRCTGWSSAFGGILWQKCNQRCVCLGYSSGACVEAPTTCAGLRSGTMVSQCQCRGKKGNPPSSGCGL
ncbi:unnamed protein product [Medioppia subpectinata]|uniref:Theromacin n=1 Tax=Medioppia subpectinata TaxID=1979941 RepID=A0A7R9L028_9ACAR|nr:unnamed protein product [Medioppia subpectinata]CAG2112711.1 unnamed protein product [Medioppia subpectinata]